MKSIVAKVQAAAGYRLADCTTVVPSMEVYGHSMGTAVGLSTGRDDDAAANAAP